MKSLLVMMLSLTALAAPKVPTLIGGTVVNRADYPATIWIGNCTASLVGPRTVLTAAHCVGSKISFSVGTDRFSAQCRVNADYRGNSTADHAACYTDREVTGVPFENVNIDPTHVVKGDKIIQSGFGCTKWGTQLDMKLRVGVSEVLSTPYGSSNDYVTGNGAVLCSGDSGGPAWSRDTDGGRDKLISVNSRSNTTSRSYLSSTSTASAIKFINSYATTFKAEICGVHATAQGCRNSVPPVPNKFSIDHQMLSLDAVMKPGFEDKLDASKLFLEEKLQDLK